jgi:hypothetical protein
LALSASGMYQPQAMDYDLSAALSESLDSLRPDQLHMVNCSVSTAVSTTIADHAVNYAEYSVEAGWQPAPSGNSSSGGGCSSSLSGAGSSSSEEKDICKIIAGWWQQDKDMKEAPSGQEPAAGVAHSPPPPEQEPAKKSWKRFKSKQSCPAVPVLPPLLPDISGAPAGSILPSLLPDISAAQRIGFCRGKTRWQLKTCSRCGGIGHRVDGKSCPMKGQPREEDCKPAARWMNKKKAQLGNLKVDPRQRTCWARSKNLAKILKQFLLKKHCPAPYEPQYVREESPGRKLRVRVDRRCKEKPHDVLDKDNATAVDVLRRAGFLRSWPGAACVHQCGGTYKRKAKKGRTFFVCRQCGRAVGIWLGTPFYNTKMSARLLQRLRGLCCWPDAYNGSGR